MTEYARSFRHDTLLSSYYLERFLPQDEAWRVPAAEVTPALSELKTLYRDLGDELPHMGERETEDRFIQKVLEILGFSYIPQPPQVAGGQPDFALFASDAEKKKARKSRSELDYKLAIAIGESKYWDRPLDRHRGQDEREEEKSRSQHPGIQITNYLYRTGLTWGILTNGVEWRLYHRDASGNRLKNYYGINLVELVEKGSEEDFRYFYILFRRESFLPVGQSLLDRALEGSRLYARELGDDLKESVYKALRILAEGFFADPKTTLSPNNHLDLIRENSLIYLYRLLFILYAESPREGEYLLPLENRAYGENYSLDMLKREIAEKAATSGSPVKHTYWEHLDTLFNLVNRGSKEFGIPEEEFVVPPYNGGLFATRLDPITGRDFFEVHRVPDLYLAQVIDLLARPDRRGANGREFVDYSSLEIRHLGSIYEGLLEYKIQVAEEEMVGVKEGRRERWIPAREAGSRKGLDRVQAGGLYLVTDRGERKATGSYYTPDYIVKYIVENTLGPLIEDKRQKVLEKVQTLQSKAKAARGYNREAYEKELRKAENELVDEILSLKVLDPAMGSGHFLVEATDYLARALVEALGGRLGLEDGPRRGKVVEIQSPYRRAKGDEDEIRWARREVVEKCIYGVDLNPLAVELAKLSLWLSTVAKDRPLSFLDHHLRCGNSLIGARVKDLSQSPMLKGKRKRIDPREIRSGDEVRVNDKIGRVVDVQLQGDGFLYEVTFPVDPPQKYLCPPNTISKTAQIGIFESIFLQNVHNLLHAFHQIEVMPSETVEDIKRKGQLYEEFEANVERFREVAHIWISVYFGNEFGEMDYNHLQDKLRASKAEWQEIRAKPWFQKALLLALNKGFFHWELEFPEVFYKGAREKANPGFDAVIGNPPYLLLQPQNVEHRELSFYKHFEVAQYKVDIYHLFIERGVKLTRQSGRVSYITPAPYLTNNYTTKLRSFILEKSCIRHLVVIPDGVFPEASVDNTVIVLERVDDAQIRKIGEVEFQTAKAASDHFELVSACRVKQDLWDEDENHIFLPKEETAPYKFRVPTVGLGEIATVNFGMQLRDRRVFAEDVIYSPNNRPKDRRYKPCYSGDDVRRYDLGYSDLYAFFDPVVRRGGCWDEEVHFAKQKLIIRQIGRYPIAAYDFRDYCCLNTVFMIVVRHLVMNPKYVLALLNSYYMRSYWLQSFYDRKETFPKIKGTYLLKLPIRRINFTTPEKERRRLLEKGKRLYEQCVAKGDQLCVTGFVEHCLAQKPEQADVVHDLLAYLAEQMMEKNKQKQVEMKGFVGWLEQEIGAKVRDLTNKTRIKGYHEGNLEELLEILKANRKRLRIDPARREFSERLKDEFDRSLAETGPLKERLVATDRLIDQIVYLLYGLTDEEVRIVEGSSQVSLR